jgi:hypothetical protein
LNVTEAYLVDFLGLGSDELTPELISCGNGAKP